jgi:pyridoxal 5-phosphate dependent beta-lyase
VTGADSAVARLWRAARPKPLGLHFDNAACSRQSFAVIDAATQHARLEAQVGGYVAAESAEPVLDGGRAAVAALTGMAAGCSAAGTARRPLRACPASTARTSW